MNLNTISRWNNPSESCCHSFLLTNYFVTSPGPRPHDYHFPGSPTFPLLICVPSTLAQPTDDKLRSKLRSRRVVLRPSVLYCLLAFSYLCRSWQPHRWTCHSRRTFRFLSLCPPQAVLSIARFRLSGSRPLSLGSRTLSGLTC